jgi:hypothetical protein
MEFLIDMFNNSKVNNVDLDDKELSKDTNEIEPEIVISKFDKNIESYEKNTINNNEEDSEKDEIIQDDNSLEEDFDSKFGMDSFKNYILPDSVKTFTKNSEFCRFNWNGIEFLDKWELQRKIDKTHATELAISIQKDYKKYKEFIFYDPVHIGKKKNDIKYYVLDGQHRLEAYLYFYERNKYPIQKIPAIIWYAEDDQEFIELFNKINSRLSIDKLKLMQFKLYEINEGMEQKYGKNIWGYKRPKIDKEIFCEKIKNNDNANNLSSEEILDKLFKINENIRGKPRASRVKPNVTTSVHNSAESLDLFLGLDRTMAWMNEL